MRAWCLCLVLLTACGDDESPEVAESESSDEVEGATPESAGDGEGEGSAPAADAPRPNRSAGPARAGFEVVPQRMHRTEVATIRIFGRHAAAGTSRGVVTIFDVPSGHVRAVRRLFFGAVGSLQVSDDRKRILAMGSGTGESDEAVEAVVWDLELDRVWPVPSDYAYLRAMSPDGRWVATIPETGEESTEIRLSEVWGDTRTRRFDDSFDALFFSHDSRTLHLGSNAGMQRLGVPGLRPRGETWPTPGGGAALHPSEDLVAFITSSGVSIHSLADGEAKAELTAPGRIGRLEWSPDGSRLAAHGRISRVFSGDDWTTTHDFPEALGAQLDLVSDIPAILRRTANLVYTPAEGDPIEFEPEITIAAAFPPRAGWFLYSSGEDVTIANLERRRTRRLVRGGAGERSAWSATVDDAAVSLHGRGWSHRFGAPAPETEAPAQATAPTEQPPMPSFPGHERQPEVEVVGTSHDGKRRLVLVDPAGEPQPYLVGEGDDEPSRLQEPAGEGFGIYCGLDYDEEFGEETYFCESLAEFAPNDEWFVMGGTEGTASFDVTGRRLGVSAGLRWVRFVGNERVLVHTEGGALYLAGKNLRRNGVVFRARERMSAYATINEAQTWVAATRGAALALYDLSADERTHMITLPSRALGTPVFEGELVQIRVEGAFLWYRLDDGTEERRVELESIRAIDADRTHALTCAGDRLRHVDIASPDESKDLGPCPLDAREMGFDGERAWWVEGSRGHVVRLSDAEHLIVGVYLLRRPLLYAFTPRGHFWTNRPDALRSLRVRMPGPVLDADAPTPEASWVQESLITDYLADLDLGDAPER